MRALRGRRGRLRGRRGILAGAALALLLLLPATPGGPPAPTAAAQPTAAAGMQAPDPAGGRVPPLRPPADAPVVRAFDLRGGPYGPGSRGIGLDAPVGSAVTAPAPGRVWFAGDVAGLGWVTVEVAPGVLASVGPLERVTVRTGAEVGARTVLGRLQDGHHGDLHLGVRVGGVYVDPLPYLSSTGPPRLVPLEAAAA